MKFNRRYFLISLGSALGLAFNSCKNFQQTKTTNVENFKSQIPGNQTFNPSEISTPSTPAPPGMFAPKQGDIRLVVISDLNSSYGSTTYQQQVEKTIPLISEWQPDLLLCAGDMIAGQKLSLTEENIQAMWNGFDRYIVTPLRQAKQPFAITIGNHDASGYFKKSGDGYKYEKERRQAQLYWSKHQNDLNINFLEADGFPFYYSFLHKEIFYLIWDASMLRIPKQQLEWVEKSLASSQAQTAKMRIVMGHLPFYAVAPTKNKIGDVLAKADELRTILEKYNVHLYISGHHHAYFPGYKGNLKLLYSGALGSGPRTLIGSNLSPRNTLTVVDINLEENKSFYTTYDMNTLAVVNPQELPEKITGLNGWVLREKEVMLPS
ncbi:MULTISPECIES: metallophosphoesterase family protein [Okeania]|uniref:Metallophosphoesterase n=1 Tax=Okeania hirsuta TaxID=1458930 RepID=A0A3N6NT78_9CYAN|nr:MULTISPECIES: metallophosphoesterase [Okeania]NES93054.1 metallophosphoesterase [Okeania sp. SIO2B9]NET76729.1 metallophosphoesterase [Okeania sp. SIO1F9]RQH15411.1 metallophosphoesterase [Okeania hirsuta]RQH57489.1 metallophosphoesterase [Okeania hirsuta]